MTLLLILVAYFALGIVVISFFGWLEFLRLYKKWKKYESKDPALRNLFDLWTPWGNHLPDDKFVVIFAIWIGWPALLIYRIFNAFTNWVSKTFKNLVNAPISLEKKKRQQLSLREVDDLIFNEEEQVHQESHE